MKLKSDDISMRIGFTFSPASADPPPRRAILKTRYSVLTRAAKLESYSLGRGAAWFYRVENPGALACALAPCGKGLIGVATL
jgi:hypothetical protein